MCIIFIYFILNKKRVSLFLIPCIIKLKQAVDTPNNYSNLNALFIGLPATRGSLD